MEALERLLSLFQIDRSLLAQVENWTVEIPRPADECPIPGAIHPVLRSTLASMGISHLYRHQSDSLLAVENGQHIMVVTGTASGKSLCYYLPVFNRMLNNPAATSLFLFPTKALSQDQAKSISRFSAEIGRHGTAFPEALVYDGDTNAYQRSIIRKNSKILISNPDMVHLGILPHHTNWDVFFQNLQFVILDEAHMYRGVFGSHIANVIRRLKRIAQFYGASPQFILSSATISNGAEFAAKLVEEKVTIIDKDGSPKGARHFILYNPPLIKPELGIRNSVYAEAVGLSKRLLASDLQSIIFTISRRSVEKLLLEIRASSAIPAKHIRGYRSGYLAQERREIENGLKEGEVKLVISTNALELGVDIGEMKAAVIVGYPGSIAALRQQAGRAGRKANSSLAVMIASPGAIDQYLARHSEYLNKSPENALIDPNNLVILLQHLQCAAFELPFSLPPQFGNSPPETVAGLLELLKNNGVLSQGGNKYFWAANKYPSNEIPIRGASPDQFILQCLQGGRPVTIGKIDPPSANWMTHPQAIYLHDGNMFQVQDLNFEDKIVTLTPANADYLTEARSETEVEKLSTIEEKQVAGGSISFGELKVTSQVTGYKKINAITFENMGEFPLVMPSNTLRTNGYWVSLDPMTVETLRLEGKWNNDPNDYGPGWNKISASIRKRDSYQCQVCGAPENGKAHHVHHKTPLRGFRSLEEANRPDNLITLCPNCHRKAEGFVKIKSGLNGLKYALKNLSPLFLMCDINDIGAHVDPGSMLAEGAPSVAIYDQISGGIGLSLQLYKMHEEMMKNVFDMVSGCECMDGCPACVGPGGEKGSGGKEETISILKCLV